MGQDPAVLFYTSDFLSGTILMTDDEVGKYIKLLCLQHQLYPDHIPADYMMSICNNIDSKIIKKFVTDKQGEYYNKRMEYEIKRRINFCNSRSNNRLKKKHMKNTCKTYEKHMMQHMENENENRNRTRNEAENENEKAEKIYSLYPRHVGKKAAIKSILKTLKEIDYESLMVRVNNYAESVKGADMQFIPHPATWFNQGRYNDPIEHQITKSRNVQKSVSKEYLQNLMNTELD